MGDCLQPGWDIVEEMMSVRRMCVCLSACWERAEVNTQEGEKHKHVKLYEIYCLFMPELVSNLLKMMVWYIKLHHVNSLTQSRHETLVLPPPPTLPDKTQIAAALQGLWFVLFFWHTMPQTSSSQAKCCYNKCEVFPEWCIVLLTITVISCIWFGLAEICKRLMVSAFVVWKRFVPACYGAACVGFDYTSHELFISGQEQQFVAFECQCWSNTWDQNEVSQQLFSGLG